MWLKATPESAGPVTWIPEPLFCFSLSPSRTHLISPQVLLTLPLLGNSRVPALHLRCYPPHSSLHLQALSHAVSLSWLPGSQVFPPLLMWLCTQTHSVSAQLRLPRSSPKSSMAFHHLPAWKPESPACNSLASRDLIRSSFSRLSHCPQQEAHTPAPLNDSQLPLHEFPSSVPKRRLLCHTPQLKLTQVLSSLLISFGTSEFSNFSASISPL